MPVQRRFRAWYGREQGLLLKLSPVDPSKRENPQWGVSVPGWCIFLVTCFIKTKPHLQLARSIGHCTGGAGQSQRHRTTLPSDTQPHRNYCHFGRSVPSLSSFQGCECHLVLQVLRIQDQHTIDAQAPALQACSATCVSLSRSTSQGLHSCF